MTVNYWTGVITYLSKFKPLELYRLNSPDVDDSSDLMLHLRGIWSAMETDRQTNNSFVQVCGMRGSADVSWTKNGSKLEGARYLSSSVDDTVELTITVSMCLFCRAKAVSLRNFKPIWDILIAKYEKRVRNRDVASVQLCCRLWLVNNVIPSCYNILFWPRNTGASVFYIVNENLDGKACSGVYLTMLIL